MSKSGGLTRCASKPASLERCRSSSWPQPVSATSTRSFPHGSLPDPAAHFVAVHSRQADIEQHDIGPEPLGGFERLDAVVRLVTSRARRTAAASPAIPRRPRCRRRPGCGGRTAGGGAPDRRLRRAGLSASRQNGQPDHELAAAAEPLAVRLDRPAVHLHQRLHQRQADAQAAARPLQRRVDLREHLEDAAADARRRCRCRCRARGSTACVAVLLDRQPDVTAAGR